MSDNDGPRHITVGGPGRCTNCSFHVATQGHRDGCDGTAPVESDDPRYTSSFLENMRRRKSRPDQTVTPASAIYRRPVDVAQPGTNPTYVRAAIDRELATLAAATEGSRNDTLHRVACQVFEFVKGGHADGAAAGAELTRIAAANGLPASEIRSTLRSAWGRVGPRDVPAPHRGVTV
jgi:hypothetical protein